MADPRTVPWSRLVGEFLVIVVGVLAALGVDSWRERKQEEDLGQAYLRGLLTDLTADSTRLADSVAQLRLPSTVATSPPVQKELDSCRASGRAKCEINSTTRRTTRLS